jgi:hypothetical protein
MREIMLVPFLESVIDVNVKVEITLAQPQDS